MPIPIMSKKLLIVIVVLVIVLGVSGYFMLYPLLAKNSNATPKYTNKEGTINIGNNTSLSKDWPSDAPAIFTGAKILYSGDSKPTTRKAGVIVSYTVPSSLKTVSDFYQSELSAKGWTIKGNANVGTQVIISAQKGDRNFGVSIADNGNGTITVTAGSEL